MKGSGGAGNVHGETLKKHDEKCSIKNHNLHDENIILIF
jgi:hypothetical protein